LQNVTARFDLNLYRLYKKFNYGVFLTCSLGFGTGTSEIVATVDMLGTLSQNATLECMPIVEDKTHERYAKNFQYT
jgi:hypothetical protein